MRWKSGCKNFAQRKESIDEEFLCGPRAYGRVLEGEVWLDLSHHRQYYALSSDLHALPLSVPDLPSPLQHLVVQAYGTALRVNDMSAQGLGQKIR